MKSFVVAKFGGTSISDYFSMNRSVDVLITDSSIFLVVLSASAGVTDLLVNLSEGLEITERLIKLNAIRKIQFNIIRYMHHPNIIQEKIEYLLQKISILSELAFFSKSAELTDELVSYGEIMSTLLFVEILHERNISAEWFDVRKVMHTNNQFGNAEPDITTLAFLVDKELIPRLSNGLIITQGFIGIEAQGRTTTLGRGGSDYTATLLGEALNATRVDIWTDVTGIYTTDPRVVPVAKRISEITFKEAIKMATFGAKILHPSTLVPAIRSNIPVFIGSSQNPKAGGTLVYNKINNTSLFRALTLCREQTLLTLNNFNFQCVQFNFFLRKILNLLKFYNISLKIISISKTKISIVLDNSFSSSYSLKNVLSIIKKIIEKSLSFCNLTTEENLALITLINNQCNYSSIMNKEVFNILKQFNIRMICHSTSNCSFFFLVLNKEAEQIIQRLHHNLFT